MENHNTDTSARESVQRTKSVSTRGFDRSRYRHRSRCLTATRSPARPRKGAPSRRVARREIIHRPNHRPNHRSLSRLTHLGRVMKRSNLIRVQRHAIASRVRRSGEEFSTVRGRSERINETFQSFTVRARRERGRRAQDDHEHDHRSSRVRRSRIAARARHARRCAEGEFR